MLQIKAIENLDRAGVQVKPAVMTSFSTPEHLDALRKRLAAIAPEITEIEADELALYGDVAERLRRAGIRYHSTYSPDKLPPLQA